MVQVAPTTRINEVRQAEIDRVAAMNVAAYQSLNKVRKYINDRLQGLERLYGTNKYNVELNKIEKYLIDEYGIMFKDLKGLIVDSINASGLEQRYLAELALGSSISWDKAKLYKTIPNIDAFKITNRVLSEKSVLRRNKKYARKVSQSISDGFKANKTVTEIQKDLDIIYGFRDRQGRTTRSALAGLKQGKFSHSSGIFYDTYRIARTESARASSVQATNIGNELKVKYNDVRMKLVEKIDSRTRQQSIEMNGDISNAKFQFRFPDGKLYRRDATNLPARWSINDRSAGVIVFLDDRPREKSKFTDLSDYERNISSSLYK